MDTEITKKFWFISIKYKHMLLFKISISNEAQSFLKSYHENQNM